jgi:hypothetical protein
MTTLRTALRRLFATTGHDDHEVHFHRRGTEPEPCYDAGCPLPRLTV